MSLEIAILNEIRVLAYLYSSRTKFGDMSWSSKVISHRVATLFHQSLFGMASVVLAIS